MKRLIGQAVGYLRAHPRQTLMFVLFLIMALPFLWTAAKVARSPHSNLWAGSYFKGLLAGEYSRADETTDLFFIMCDHWEPGRGPEAVARSQNWLDRYRQLVEGHTDSDGRLFQYTWYYPIDRMDDNVLDQLAGAAADDLGEIEVHWHHNHNSSQEFSDDLAAALKKFAAVGALVEFPSAEPQWNFIHGNWALDGSSPGQCGINNEISIMQNQGCYADFTFPAIEATGQPEIINSIYYTHDTPEPKSYNTGHLAQAGKPQDGFMIFQGPLGMDFRNPLLLIESAAIDNAEGTGLVGKLRPPKNYADYFKTSRIALWDNIHVSVQGKPEWCFVKVHAHGHQDMDILLDGQLEAMLDGVEGYCEDRNIRLHYVTAREACNLVWAVEKGLTGTPSQYYDLVVPRPWNRQPGFKEGK